MVPWLGVLAVLPEAPGAGKQGVKTSPTVEVCFLKLRLEQNGVQTQIYYLTLHKGSV